ncbi:MAG: UDP-N-acetylglucosamine diphosphorylase [Waddliaceae bacterium]|jgi:UDP-N-acetylglucosamine diphosphorylase / glucose-1-phosphate thymidylyltransferase / UDP-N-acetylgalactosamine diphosphorylase / glucosamine-1-phosphate N-acetyltransferase / galactosamine-1-phosphate N-acetyltransferase|nr:UDP-N-acetylglucosamine diphosphorylase [Waddliaceae bacterium]MBT3579363.1 UDP-N-acetylglucosamine diphosphorylase [Waddliaceae bacterium]MBT4444853.1 UDP-N-acetylglucosamine diphosphorylase [Waddliaceae bacterium]MBT6928011.1 UDP-N-acetylglucosamine diphosphorylase [Waddliaceae bacterium]MBT7264313.1 UDP-N-acetylglucosamine diphosphorylase [Waddliaceae bacterium]
MSLFKTSDYFDLTEFQHKELFDLEAPVWETLKKLKEFCSSFHYPTFQYEAPGAYFVNPSMIVIGEGTVVEPGAYIEGPCIIGKGCTIRHGAYLRGNVVVGDGCVIGHATEVKHSIFLNGAKAAHFAYVGDSILGNNVNFGAGTKCANVKLDKRLVIIDDNGSHIETGLKKCGAIVGDDAQLGCNCVTNPGTLIGPRSRCYPCLNIGGVVHSDAIVKPASKNETILIKNDK